MLQKQHTTMPNNDKEDVQERARTESEAISLSLSLSISLMEMSLFELRFIRGSTMAKSCSANHLE